ncbi:hypothetical protein Q7P37_001290 [Cladosporium fusiforme]
MIPSGPLFITASVDHKIVNVLLLRFREEMGYDWATIITRQDGLDLEKHSDEEEQETVPPLQSLDNAWSGSNIANVEAFMLAQNKRLSTNPCSCFYIALDDDGVATETCIIGERVMDKREEDDSGSSDKTNERSAASRHYFTDRFQRMRVPWEEAQNIWVNRDVGNMDFEDFTQGQEPDANGIHNMYRPEDEEERRRNVEEMGREELELWREQGFVDEQKGLDENAIYVQDRSEVEEEEARRQKAAERRKDRLEFWRRDGLV